MVGRTTILLPNTSFKRNEPGVLLIIIVTIKESATHKT
jgi:hypothetical protein